MFTLRELCAVWCLVVLQVQTVTTSPSSPCRPAGYRYFVSDQQQCDRFHMCDEEGQLAAEFLCEDGLVFDMISQQCGLPFKIGCEESGRLLLQQADPVGNCPRRNGKWAVEGTCNQYVDCTSGVERLITCQNHLVYDEETGDCEHPDVADRPGCTAEELYDFVCPVRVGTSRHPAPSDCRAFFTCSSFTNYHPRLSRF